MKNIFKIIQLQVKIHGKLSIEVPCLSKSERTINMHDLCVRKRCIGLLKMMNNLSSRKNLLDGFEDITWVESRCFGRVKHNAGATLTLKDQCATDLRST